MNEHEAQRIAGAISLARTDWPTQQVLTLIRTKLMDRPRRDVFVALAWVASEPTSTTPYRVLESGPWWQAVGIEGTTAPRNPYDPTTACDVCSLPENRHTDLSGHEFVSAHDAMRRRDTSPKPPLPRRHDTEEPNQ